MLARYEGEDLYFQFATGCGLALMKIEVQKDGKKMILNFTDVMGDMEFVLDSIPFQPGEVTYNINKFLEAKVVGPDKLNYEYRIPPETYSAVGFQKAVEAIRKACMSSGMYRGERINCTDTLGKKQGFWITFGKDLPLDKDHRKYEDSAIVECGTYVKGMKEGMWFTYGENNVITSTIEYANDRPKGNYTFYYENGKYAEQGRRKNGRPYDYISHFYRRGCIEDYYTLDSMGKRNGMSYYYFDLGPDLCAFKRMEVMFRNDKEVWKIMYERDERRSDTVFFPVDSVKAKDPGNKSTILFGKQYTDPLTCESFVFKKNHKVIVRTYAECKAKYMKKMKGTWEMKEGFLCVMYQTSRKPGRLDNMRPKPRRIRSVVNKKLEIKEGHLKEWRSRRGEGEFRIYK
ncbi:MAG: toxin-antitoxin system YwqK family antitoxin [Bacteroidia bacterium]